MKKNNVIGWIAIAAVMFGFMFYQSKQIEKQQKVRFQQDSIARVQLLEQQKRDSLEKARTDSLIAIGELPDPALAQAAKEEAPVPVEEKTAAPVVAQTASQAEGGESQFVTLSNDKLEVVFTTKGAQPYSAKVKGYTNYDKSDLYIFNSATYEGANLYNVRVFAGDLVNTKDFEFQVVSSTDSSVVMRLPFLNGGYIEQEYTLAKESYIVDNKLSFINLDIPKNAFSYDIDWAVLVPRMEKGYRNEVQYSKAAYRLNSEEGPKEFAKGRSQNETPGGSVSWVAYHQQFFSAIFRAKNNITLQSARVIFLSENDPARNLMACGSSFRKDFSDVTAKERVYEHEFYFGPNSYKGMKALGQGYEKTIPLGGSIIGLFTKYVIIPVFDFLDGFDFSYGIIILLMTIFIKIVVFPLAYKSFVSSAKMQILRPEVEKINAKYPKQEDAMKKQQATMALYKRAGASMMGGCLPMLLQFPVLWAMFRFFPASIELRQQPFLWAEDLSSYDSIISFNGGIPLIGDHLSLFALLMAVSMFFYTKLTGSAQMGGNDPNGKMMRYMTVYFMPVMMFFICNSLSSALSYYYLLSNIITMLETWAIRKWVVKPEDVYARLRATEGKPMPKSKWQQRLEQAQRMQQQRNGR